MKKIDPTKEIYSGEIILTNNNQEIIVKGKVTNFFSNRYKIKVTGRIKDNENVNPFNICGVYDMKAGNYLGSMHLYAAKGNEIFGDVLKELTTEISYIKKLGFDFVNFIQVRDVPLKENDDCLYKASLNYNDWVIELNEIQDYKLVSEHMREYGGFAITHKGKITRENKEFTYDEANEVLNKFYTYVSFLSGKRLYPTGFYGSGNSFERYEAKNIDLWGKVHNWYPDQEREIKQELFNGFNSFWDNKDWYLSKNILLGTYLECFASVTLENKITSIQTALELISKLYLVDYKKNISHRKFKNLNTKERLMCLFEIMEIALDVPTDYINRNLEFEYDPIDFVVNVRNSIVHANKKVGLTYNNIKVAYYLGLWFLEIVFLNLFGYQGRYKNRLAESKYSGDVEKGGNYYYVPWK